MIKLPEILPMPSLPGNLPPTAKWLAGEGAGSWFVIEMENDFQYKIDRFSPKGHIECTGLFRSTSKKIDMKKNYEITYPSHCATVSILQEEVKITLISDQKSKFKHT